MFNERPVPLQTLQHWSLPVSQPGVSWPVLFSCHTLQWRIPGDPSPAWSDRELWMKVISMPDVALTANSCYPCIMHKQPQEEMLWEKKQITLCRTSSIWPLPCKPDPVPLLTHHRVLTSTLLCTGTSFLCRGNRHKDKRTGITWKGKTELCFPLICSITERWNES